MVIIYRCPEPEKLTTKTLGCKWARPHSVSVGLEELSSEVIQDVMSQISDSLLAPDGVAVAYVQRETRTQP
jgi:hypothetical protein